MDTAKNNLTLIGAALLGILVICCTVLVALDKIDGPLFMAALVSPIVGGIIGGVAVAKGTQTSAAVTDQAIQAAEAARTTQTVTDSTATKRRRGRR